jgi:palmitoyltransferase
MAGRPGYITLPIISVLAAIGYVYYTTVFLAIPAWLGLNTAAGVANAAAYTALAVACVATYGLAITRDPGRVPPAFVPDVEDAETPIHEIKRKVSPCIPSSCASRDRPTRSRCKDWIFGVTGMQN